MKTLGAKTINEYGALEQERSDVGGKGYNLIRLKEQHLHVPEFFVLGSEAFMNSLPKDARENWSKLNTAERVSIVEKLRIADSVLAEVSNELGKLFAPKMKIAVRSSAVDEDGTAMSYAGQFTSLLNVERNEVATAIETVWRSGFTKQLLAYRALNGCTSAPEPPSVILQQMVSAKTAGVAFGADPMTGDRDVVMISSVNGLGDKLVSGEVDSAIYRLKGSLVESRWNETLGLLTDDQIFEIYELVNRTKGIFGCPQDIEWAIDEDNQLFILQSRPITTLGAVSVGVEGTNFGGLEPEEGPGFSYSRRDAGGPEKSNLPSSILIFDNSNIGESYPGTTTPLTFSFARKAYQHVYEEFCRLMGVSEKSIAKHAFIFPKMLGYVRGRIYYNLLNWYRLLSLFPGFKTNRGFMEQMMGVKAGLPADFLAEFDKPLPPAERVRDAISVAVLLPKLLYKWLALPRDIKVFNRRVETSFTRVPSDLSVLTDVELASLYRSLEQDLLLHWDAPIVNDFFAMVSFGLLRSVCSKWFKDIDGLHNQLLCGETGIVSTEPVARMQKLALEAAGQPTLLKVLQTGDINLINRELPNYPDFYNLYQSYLEKFGDRCAGELKLESPTVVDNPQALISGILRLATESRSASMHNSNRAQQNRVDAEQAAYKSLGNNLIKAFLFRIILAETRNRIRERENLRFMRTRVFGLVRKIFVQIGKRFEEAGTLNDYQDVFYLETEEVLGFIEGKKRTSNESADSSVNDVNEKFLNENVSNKLVSINQNSKSDELKLLTDARKKEAEIFQTMPSPPDRFSVLDNENVNYAPLAEQGEETKTELSLNTKTLYKGLGCCPGIVRGYARIIDDPDTQQLKPGEILVAKRTDPGWITVIAQATGIVVEYGSLLSHTAIVSRELGIPTIVSVSNVTSSVKTGEWLEINGATGEVRVTSSQEVVALTATMESKKVVAMKSEIQSKAGFSFIRYSQCWEDTDIVLEGMSINPGDNCLSIASAGDNSLAMLAKNPGKVVALDLSASQLALLELKATAFKCLSYEDMLILLGYRTGKSRTELFELVENELSPGTRAYWNEHLDDIEFGVASIGKFERYFAMFRKFVLPLVHSKDTIDELLQWRTKEQRIRFYTSRWNTFKWRALFKLFFSEPVMGLLGRDPSFFKYAEGGLAEVLLKWTKKALVDQNPSNNPYLHWILKGEFRGILPNFLRKENFSAIKTNIDKLEWYQQSLEEYLSTHPAEQFNSFNLSDVFEYISEDNYRTIMKLIAEASAPKAKVVYWNMMAPRTTKSAGIEEMRSLTALSKALFAENKTFFYSRFVVDEVRVGQTRQSDLEGTDKIVSDNKDRAA